MSTIVSCNGNDPHLEIQAIFNASSERDAREMVDQSCHDAVLSQMQSTNVFDFDRFSNMDHDFNKAFFDGGSSWNDGGMTSKQAKRLQKTNSGSGNASGEFSGNSNRILLIKRAAERRFMSWPDSHTNFDRCDLNAVMCCWVEHDDSQDDHYGKNTDLCYVDNSRAPSSSHITGGLSFFSGSEDAFCHGFAWGDGSLDDSFKGNVLFLAEIYELMHNRGLSKNVPGAPMCGCVEQMPVVTRADCSKIKASGDFIFRHTSRSSTNFVKARGQITLGTVDCDGVNGGSNDLGMYYEKLFSEDKVNATQKAVFDSTIVGEQNCASAVEVVSSAFLPETDESTGNFIQAPSITSLPSSAPSTHHVTSNPTYFQNLTSVTSDATTTSAPSPSSLHPSVHPSIWPSSSPSISQRPSVTPEYAFVGYGDCRSSLNRGYDTYYATLLGTPELCSRHCRKQEGFVGFTIRHSYYCHCHYEDGYLPNPCPTNNCSSHPNGVGEITSSTGDTERFSCYKYQWYIPRNPSSQPSSSAQPSISVQPSLSPSYEPSSHPSESSRPSNSLSPSSSPSLDPLSPTLNPVTANPTNAPTKMPVTANPSYSPTRIQPSTNPSVEPSAQPSSSVQPTFTSYPSKSPSVYPSAMPSTTSSPSTSPSISQRPSVTPEYAFVGYGDCRSSLNRGYDTYYATLLGTPELCSRHCRKQEGFVGFTIRHSYYCHCHYEDGYLPNPCPTNNCSSHPNGVGEITSSTGDTERFSCYKYQWYIPRNPSSQPSSSAQPSVSVQPSLSPSHEPSSHPSESSRPSNSLSPSSSPSLNPSFLQMTPTMPEPVIVSPTSTPILSVTDNPSVFPTLQAVSPSPTKY